MVESGDVAKGDRWSMNGRTGLPSSDGAIRALLFAAGESSRMGTPKPLLAWHGEPLVAYQVRQLHAAGVAGVIVVVGHEAARVGAVAEPVGARTVLNDDYRSGRASSVRAGALALPDDTGTIVILSVDQPRSAALIRRVLDAHLAGGAAITTPERAGRRGHPVIIAGELLPELRAVSESSEGLRAVVRRNADRRLIVPVDDPAIHLEFNTPEEYAAALRPACAGGTA
jgi:molybdenum cofactor cytidylyltransferase